MNVDYPLRFDDKGRMATTEQEDQIRDMIAQILFTVPGERVNRPDFGGGLAQLVFAPNCPEFAATAQLLVQASLQKWLGHLIRVEKVEVSALKPQLTMEIQYTILKSQIKVNETFPSEEQKTWNTSVATASANRR
jgi:uncharacterized protein